MNEGSRGLDVFRLLKDAERQEIEIVTSFLTLGEVVRFGSVSAAGTVFSEQDLKDLFDRAELEMVTVDRFVGEKAREIRRQAPRLGKNRFMVGDAIHIATALLSEVDALYSYDDDDLVKYDGYFDGLKKCNPVWNGQLTLPTS